MEFGKISLSLICTHRVADRLRCARKGDLFSDLASEKSKAAAPMAGYSSLSINSEVEHKELNI